MAPKFKRYNIPFSLWQMLEFLAFSRGCKVGTMVTAELWEEVYKCIERSPKLIERFAQMDFIQSQPTRGNLKVMYVVGKRMYTPAGQWMKEPEDVWCYDGGVRNKEGVWFADTFVEAELKNPQLYKEQLEERARKQREAEEA